MASRAIDLPKLDKAGQASGTDVVRAAAERAPEPEAEPEPEDGTQDGFL